MTDRDPSLNRPTQILVFGATKSLDDVLALSGVDLSIEGGLTTLLGPNGAGKTTLLRCLSTVWTVDGGSVMIDGLDPGHERDRIEIRRRLGYLPQDPGLANGARVFDVVDYAAVMKRVGAGSPDPERRRRQEVMEQLIRVGVADRASDRVASLSGGMRRRVGLAQALLGSPTLLVLDEPAAGLDPEERARLRSILSERRHRATVVQSTHLTDEAAYSDRVLVMTAGRVVFAGTPSRLASLAEGRTWQQTEAPDQSSRRGTTVLAHWRQADGTYRCLGTPPDGSTTVDPRLEDGYLLLQQPGSV